MDDLKPIRVDLPDQFYFVGRFVVILSRVVFSVEIVQSRVKAEYEQFLQKYRDMPEKLRFAAMVKDADKIAFYRDTYVLIIIRAPFSPRDWRWFQEYYFGKQMIAGFYESRKRFEKEVEQFLDRSPKRREEMDKKFIDAYVQGAKEASRAQNVA